MKHTFNFKELAEITNLLKINNILVDSFASNLKIYMDIDQKIAEITQKASKFTNRFNIEDTVHVSKSKLFKLFEEYSITSMSNAKQLTEILKHVNKSNSYWSLFIKCTEQQRSGTGEWVFPLSEIKNLILEINNGKFN